MKAKTMAEMSTGTNRETVQSSDEGHRSSKIAEKVMSEETELSGNAQVIRTW